MEEQSLVATTSSPSAPPSIGFDIFSILGSGDGISGLFSLGGVFAFLGGLWAVIVFLGYGIAIVFLVLYVYASTRLKHYQELNDEALRQQEELYNQQYRGATKNSRLEDVLRHSQSDSPNDWKLAIIEADIILDDILKQRGYAGVSLGERLKSISPNQLESLDDAWEAHKVRNRIAHEGADFILTKRLTEETIGRYRRVFAEFGVR